MFVAQESLFYYLTVMNENYVHPPMPDGVEAGILKGMYCLRTLGEEQTKKARLLGSGAILREVEAAAEILHSEHGVTVEVWSVTSFTELAREVQDCERWNLLNPGEDPRQSYVSTALPGDAPVVAASDYVKSIPEQIRGAIKAPYHVLGTDGYGRSDTREQLRSFFEVDRRFIALAALSKLAQAQLISSQEVLKAQETLEIEPIKPNPRLH
jgi:pyruvate dehydrogenase E1 component